MDYVWVGLGGCVGANARFALSHYLTSRMGENLPWATMTVNILGSFLIGVILTVLTERVVADPALRLLLVVGILGGFTTFSSYTWEAISLAERGHWLGAIGYVLGSNGVGLAACIGGVALARQMLA